MNYIGVDCHISTLDFAVVSERGIVKNKGSVKTSVKGFMEFVKTERESILALLALKVLLNDEYAPSISKNFHRP